MSKKSNIMLTIIGRTILSLLFSLGLICLNIDLANNLIIHGLKGILSWVIVSGISIVWVLYLRSQLIILNKKIKEN